MNEELLTPIAAIARRAGAVIAEVYAGAFAVRDKRDASPVTEADERAEALIVPALQALAPGLAIVAEEAVAAAGVPACGERFWLVDPLDGTREFVARNGEFTVNIALVERGAPVAGVVHAPALGLLFAGALGTGAWMEDARGRRAIACRALPPAGATVLASRSHGDRAALDAFLAGRAVAAIRRAGSSLKLAWLAAGEADAYPRFGPTMGWDIAAGHAVLAAAGGDVVDFAGQPLRYAAPFENGSFVAGSADGLRWAGVR
ncbi:MAG TPA: 3'(2'),5'-bisphosphate nucleotidase CysQ [Albitalea sp.]